jgi:hypothetical protein
MVELKEKTFTKDVENSQSELEMEENRFNPLKGYVNQA